MTATAAIDRETVVEVMVDVWASFLGDESIIEAFDEPSTDGLERIVASVFVEGPWSGAILVGVSEETGREIAAALLAVPVADVSRADINDALGEVANVVGGNLKTLLPPPSTLSLPIVAAGGQAQVVPAGATPVLRVTLSWAGAPVEVSVWESH
jgi:chemotaxis protein CheX